MRDVCWNDDEFEQSKQYDISPKNDDTLVDMLDNTSVNKPYGNNLY